MSMGVDNSVVKDLKLNQALEHYREKISSFDKNSGEKNYFRNLCGLVSEETRLAFFKSLFVQLVTITSGILFKEKIVHCDIKTTNIFVDLDNEFWSIYSKELIAR